MLEEAMFGVLGVHVASGIAALLSGFGAIVTRPKGGRVHRKAGKLFVYAMTGALSTAIVLSVARESLFLLLVAIFTGYAVFTGYRVLSRKRPTPGEADLIDRVVHWGMAVTGLVMIAYGAGSMLAGSVSLHPVLVVFGALGVWTARGELHAINEPPADQRAWFYNHIGFMGGAYIAAVTAAVAVNIQQLPPLVAWFGPSAIGVPLIEYTTRRYRRRFEAGTPVASVDPDALDAVR